MNFLIDLPLTPAPAPQQVIVNSCSNQPSCSCECCNLKLCDLSSNEIRKLRKLFSEYSGLDRKLSFPEFLKLMRSNPNLTGCCTISVCFLKRCFEQSDLNCDGLINFDQFLYAYCLSRPECLEENVCCQQTLEPSRPCTGTPTIYCEEPCYDVQQVVEPVACCQEEPYIECWEPRQVFEDHLPPPTLPVCQPRSQIYTCDPCNNQIINLPPLPTEVEKLLHRTPRKRTVMHSDEIYSNPDLCPNSIGTILPPLSPEIERLLKKSNRNRRRTYHRRY